MADFAILQLDCKDAVARLSYEVLAHRVTGQSRQPNDDADAFLQERIP